MKQAFSTKKEVGGWLQMFTRGRKRAATPLSRAIEGRDSRAAIACVLGRPMPQAAAMLREVGINIEGKDFWVRARAALDRACGTN